MKELKETFTKKGVEYTQLYKDNKLVIYQCKVIYDDYEDIYYEVFNYKVSSMNPLTPNYDPNEKVELYPKDNSFGYWAWCCSNWKCVARVLKLHYDYTDNDIRELSENNQKLTQLRDAL
jgi:hypothetical protein